MIVSLLSCYLFISVWTHAYLLYTLGYNVIVLFCSIRKIKKVVERCSISFIIVNILFLLLLLIKCSCFGRWELFAVSHLFSFVIIQLLQASVMFWILNMSLLSGIQIILNFFSQICSHLCVCACTYTHAHTQNCFHRLHFQKWHC